MTERERERRIEEDRQRTIYIERGKNKRNKERRKERKKER